MRGENPQPDSRETGKKQDRRSFSFIAAVLVPLFFFATTLFLTAPIGRHPATDIIGDLTGTNTEDLAGNLWGSWYIDTNLYRAFSDPVSLRTTPLFFYPTGFNVSLFLDYKCQFFSLPFMLATDNQALITNLSIWSKFTFNGLAMYLLLRTMKTGRTAALAGGVVFTFNTWIFEELTMGNLNHIIIGFFPLFLIALRAMITRRSIRWQALAGAVWLSLLFLPYDFFPFFAVLLSVPLAIRELIKTASFRKKGPWLNVTALLVLGVCLSLPLIFPHISTLIKTGQVHGLKLESLFSFNSEQNKTLGENVFQHVGTGTEPSWTTWRQPGTMLLLAAVVLMPFSKRKDTFFWAVSTVIWYLLAMGPYLVFTTGTRLPLPYLFFYHVVPFFPRITWPKRFLVMFFLSAGILVGLVMDGMYRQALHKGLSRRTAKFFLAAILVLTVLLSYPTFSKHLPKTKLSDVPLFYEELAKEEKGAVIDLPLDIPAAGQAAIRFQLVHGKPMLTGPGMNFPDSLPTAFKDLMRENSFFQFLKNLPDDDNAPGFDQSDLAWARDTGFSHIILHIPFFALKSYSLGTYYRPGDPDSLGIRGRASLIKTNSGLTKLFGPPVYRDDLIIVFDIRT